MLGGGAVAASGYLLMFPFYGTDIANMQLAQIIHGIIALLFVATMLGHIYIGTIGMEGAFEGMWDGTVDVNWAKEHHDLWPEEETPKGMSAPPAGRQHAGRGVGVKSTLARPGGAPAGRFHFMRSAVSLTRPAIIAACASSASPAGAARARPRSSPK